MSSYPWQITLIVAGMAVAGLASYYTSRISLAEELGNRPTREEVNGHVQELKEIIVREVTEIKEQQKSDAEHYQEQQGEVRQDIRDLREVIINNLQAR
jgi:sensor histidine kinase YesM